MVGRRRVAGVRSVVGRVGPVGGAALGWNQAYDVPNLFVTDGSCMTSSACQNPSITDMALATRATDCAVKELKRGNL